MKKVAFIIPGFKLSPKRKEYQSIGRFLEQKDITPVYVVVKWKHSTISQNAAEFVELLSHTKSDQKYIIGFSFGAVIAYIAASQERVNSVILCSLSPYFSEDLPSLKKYWKDSIGKNRIKDFQQIFASKLAKSIRAETYLLFGTKEGPEVEKRVTDTYKALKSKKQLITLEGVKHNIADERYLQEVKRVIDQLQTAV